MNDEVAAHDLTLQTSPGKQRWGSPVAKACLSFNGLDWRDLACAFHKFCKFGGSASSVRSELFQVYNDLRT